MCSKNSKNNQKVNWNTKNSKNVTSYPFTKKKFWLVLENASYEYSCNLGGCTGVSCLLFEVCCVCVFVFVCCCLVFVCCLFVVPCCLLFVPFCALFVVLFFWCLLFCCLVFCQSCWFLSCWVLVLLFIFLTSDFLVHRNCLITRQVSGKFHDWNILTNIDFGTTQFLFVQRSENLKSYLGQRKSFDKLWYVSGKVGHKTVPIRETSLHRNEKFIIVKPMLLASINITMVGLCVVVCCLLLMLFVLCVVSCLLSVALLSVVLRKRRNSSTTHKQAEGENNTNQ